MGDTALHLLLPGITDPELACTKYLNFLAALAARKQGAATLHHLPMEMTLDISTVCQLRCPYCDVGNKRIHRQPGFIPETDFARYLSGFAHTTFVVWLFSAGEPLLHPRAEALLDSMRGYETFPIVSTNLSFPFSSGRVDALLHSGLGMLSVSLDGATPETYGRYRVGGSFHRVLDNLRRLVNRKRERGLERPYIEWRFLLFRHNQHEVAAACRLAEEVGVDILEFSPGFAPDTPPEGDSGTAILRHNLTRKPDTFSLGPACEQGALRRDGTLRRLLAGNHHPAVPRVHNGPGKKSCDWLYLGGMLYPDGALAPCCVLVNEEDDFTHMKPRQADFSAAWNSTRFTETRAALSAGRKPDTACAHCPMPAAKDFQFHQRIRAVLHNAPDWVLRLLARDPNAFFLPFDRDVLFPRELSCLQALDPLHDPEEDREVAAVLRRISGKHPGLRKACDAVSSMLEADAPPSTDVVTHPGVQQG